MQRMDGYPGVQKCMRISSKLLTVVSQSAGYSQGVASRNAHLDTVLFLASRSHDIFRLFSSIGPGGFPFLHFFASLRLSNNAGVNFTTPSHYYIGHTAPLLKHS